ncbi:MAG: hypothetical protein HY043_19635 [Verrucomicrobia bacterium]|nr:hypothetical protein [Verrucomicrobiota bacterium]
MHPLLQDDDAQVRQAAVEAIGKIETNSGKMN